MSKKEKNYVTINFHCSFYYEKNLCTIYTWVKYNFYIILIKKNPNYENDLKMIKEYFNKTQFNLDLYETALRSKTVFKIKTYSHNESDEVYELLRILGYDHIF